jgi:hypothetical protein
MIKLSRSGLLDLYKRDKQAALDYVLDQGEQSLYGCAHVHQSYRMIGGGTAGSYHSLRRATLEGRTYDIEFTDDSVSIHFTDMLYDPRTFKHVHLPNLL